MVIRLRLHYKVFEAPKFLEFISLNVWKEP